MITQAHFESLTIHHWAAGIEQTGKRPQPEDIHPAFLGYFHRRRSDRGSRDPMVSCFEAAVTVGSYCCLLGSVVSAVYVCAWRARW